MLSVFIDILQPISSGCDQLVQVVYFTLAIMPFLDLNFVFKCFKTLPGSWTNPSLRLLALLCCIVIDIFRLMTLYDQKIPHNHGRPSALILSLLTTSNTSQQRREIIGHLQN